MSNIPKAAGPKIVSVWEVSARIREDTINMLEFLAIRRRFDQSRGAELDKKEIVIGQMAWIPNVPHQEWMNHVNTAVSTCGSVVKRLQEVPQCAIDGKSIEQCCEQIVKETGLRMKHMISNARGQRIIKHEPDGAILAVPPESVIPEGVVEEKKLGISADVAAETDRIMNSPPEEEGAAEEPGPEDGAEEPVMPAEEPAKPTGPRKILRPGEANAPKGAKLQI